MNTISKGYIERMKRLFSLITTAALLFATVSCTSEETPIDEVSETAVEQEVEYVIALADIAAYTVIRPERASDTLVSAVAELYRELREIDTGIVLRDDYYREDLPEYAMGENEILVGATNRPESAEFLSELRSRDYGYALVDGKLIVAGTNEEYTAMAVRELLKNVVGAEREDGIFYSSSDDRIVSGDYPLNSLKIGGTSVFDYTIVYDADGGSAERICAEILAERIADKSGYVLDVVPDTESSAAHTILLDCTSEEGSVTVENGGVHLTGGDAEELLSSVNGLGELIAPTVSRDVEVGNGTYTYPAERETMSAMSFNILCGQLDDYRTDRVLRMIKSYMPDTVGVQEAVPQWMKLLEDELGEWYGIVGEGRDGGENGEYNAILYNKAMFTLIDSGTRWLSDTPEVTSKVEESSLNRVFTYALLERRTDGRRVMLVNTHLEHTSSEARDRQSAILCDLLPELAGDCPILLTGDFNTERDTTAYANVLDGGFSDSSEVAAEAYRAATFTDFGSTAANIDYIFVTDTVEVSSYRVCNERIDGEYPSDHHPILVKYTLGE